jgi:hypothetical protein
MLYEETEAGTRTGDALKWPCSKAGRQLESTLLDVTPCPGRFPCIEAYN